MFEIARLRRLARYALALTLSLFLGFAPMVVPGPASAAAEGVSAQKPLETVVVHSNHHRYVLKVWSRKTNKQCLPHAYGAPVRHFLRRHHCTGVTRWLVTTKVNGRGVGFAQSAVGFTGRTQSASYRAAGRFRTLVTRNGTGNFYPLFHDGYRTPAGPQYVPSPAAFNALVQDIDVTIVDAWYLHGKTPQNAKPLERMARDIYLQWY